MPPSSKSPLLERSLPVFKRASLDGQRFDSSAHRGRVVVVKFFAEFCAPCQKTLPAVETLHTEMPDVTVVGISEDEQTEAALRQVQRYGLSFPVVLDRGQGIAGRFRVRELPATFVADRRGRIVWVGTDKHDEQDLRQAVIAAAK